MPQFEFFTAYKLFWLVVIMVTVVVEAHTYSLIGIWFAIGAAVAYVADILGAPFGVQMALFVMSSSVLLWLVRPMVKRGAGKDSTTNFERIIGVTGVVIVPLDWQDGTGQIKVLGEIWSAKTDDKTDIAEGEQVKILRVEGVKAVVERVSQETGFRNQ